MNAIRKIDHTVAVGPQIYRTLRQRIISADLTPGTFLSESEIGNEYGLSRQPVREAFIKLSEEGLLEIRPQRGTLVRKISIDAVLDARFIREAIEADIVKIVAKESDPAVVSELRRLIEVQQGISQTDPAAFLKTDEKFHKTLAEAAGKSSAWKVLEGLKSQLNRVRFLCSWQLSMSKVIEQHEIIVEAIAESKPNKANTAMRKHLREVLKDIRSVAQEYPEFFESVDHTNPR